jgi:hypothetical protein
MRAMECGFASYNGRLGTSLLLKSRKEFRRWGRGIPSSANDGIVPISGTRSSSVLLKPFLPVPPASLLPLEIFRRFRQLFLRSCRLNVVFRLFFRFSIITFLCERFYRLSSWLDGLLARP